MSELNPKGQSPAALVEALADWEKAKANWKKALADLAELARADWRKALADLREKAKADCEKVEVKFSSQFSKEGER